MNTVQLLLCIKSELPLSLIGLLNLCTVDLTIGLTVSHATIGLTVNLAVYLPFSSLSVVAEHGNTLNMLGLREEVEASNGLNLVFRTLFQKVSHVSSLSMHVTRDVDQSLGLESNQLVDEGLVSTLSRRIDNHASLGRVTVEILKNILGLSGQENGVVDFVELGILSSKLDTLVGDLHSVHLLNSLRTGDREQSRSTVSVNQESGGLPPSRRMFSRTYAVTAGRMELLFWKNSPAVKSNR